MGGTGKDFTNGGANANETFGGADDDFIFPGASLDAAFGDRATTGKRAATSRTSCGTAATCSSSTTDARPDILIGQGGDDDHDMEGGDDIGVGGSGIEKVAGASAMTGRSVRANSCPRTWTGPAYPAAEHPAGGVRDKFNEVEALPGLEVRRQALGDDIVPAEVGGWLHRLHAGL